MINVMEIDGYKAVIKYDSEIGMFRGEFIGLNGGADFYATTVDGLREEGSKSLKVFLEKMELGQDIIYVLGGGERSHIGGIVVCEPGKKAIDICLEGHYDDIVLKPIAEEASKKYKTKVVVVGGVHVDNASKEEIEILVRNCKELIKCI